MDLIEEILTLYRFFEETQPPKSLKDYKYIYIYIFKYKYFSNDFIFQEVKGNLYNSI